MKTDFDYKVFSPLSIQGRANGGAFDIGKQDFEQERIGILDMEARYAALQVDGEARHTVAIRKKRNGVDFSCTCEGSENGQFCRHMVAAGLFMNRHLRSNGSAAWKEPLDRALVAASASDTNKPGRPYFLCFCLTHQFSNWALLPYIVDVSRVLELTGPSLREKSSQSIIDLIRQNSWLGAQARRVDQKLDPAGCVNCPPSVVSIANVIRRSEGTGSGYSFYGYTRPVEDYLALLAGSGSPVFIGDLQNPLKTPVQIVGDPGELLVRIESDEEGDIVVRACVSLDGRELALKPGEVSRLSQDPVWVCFDERVFRIGFEDGEALLNAFLENPVLRIPREHETDFLEHYLLPIADSFRVVGEQLAWEEIRVQPKPRLYLSDEAQQLVVRLHYGYSGADVPYDPGAPVVSHRHKQDGTWTILRIHRDLDRETEIYKSISGARSGLKYLRGEQPENAFSLRSGIDVIDFLVRKVPALIDDGFEIFGEEQLRSGRVNRSLPTLTLEVSSGIDWFDLRAVVRFGDVEVSLKEVRRALRKKKRYVKLADGSIGELPEAWVDRYRHLFGLGEQTDFGVRLSSQHITLVEELLNEADQKRMDREFNRRVNRLKNFKGIPDVLLPEGFVGDLRPYQKAGYDWLHFLKDYGFGGCLADDMGLGKTVQVLVFLQSLYENGMRGKASLVVLPRSLLFNWQREAMAFTPGLRILEHFGQTRGKDPSEFGRYDVVLTTYGTMRRDIQLLRSYEFAYAILDESQAIKNPNAQVSKAARLLIASRRLVLTGTPVENSTYELWSQFSFLNPGLLGGLEYFKREFANPIERGQDEETADFLRSLVYPFILRRTKKQVAPELPPRIERVIYGEMEPAQKRFYEKTRDYYRGVLLGMIEEKGLDDSRMKILEGLLRLRQISNHPGLVEPEFRGKAGKMEMLVEHLETLRAEGHKALVFSQFVKMLKLISKELDQRGIPYVYLDGRTQNRQAVVDRFQEDDAIPFFLISLRAGGVGLNLTAADYVIHVDPWWNPAVEMQASDRTHRIGQDKPVFIYKLIMRDTVEEKILQLQEHKRALVEKLIATEGSIFKDLSAQDIQVLFS